MTTNYVSSHTEFSTDDWPLGRTKTCTAIFTIETKETKRGSKQRCSRTTVINGRTSKPKTTTYGTHCVILKCDEGKTYVATYDGPGWSISIMEGTMKYSHEYVTSDDERYQSIVELFKSVVNP